MTAPDRRDPTGASVEEWRRLVRKALGDDDLSVLNTSTRDGLVVEPLYWSRRDGCHAPCRGARPWTVVQVVDDPDPDAANAQALVDLGGGATGLALRFAGAPTAADGGLPVSADSLKIALEGVDVAAIHIRVEPHAEGVAIAGWVRDLVEQSGTAPELTEIAFGLDPIAVAFGGAGGGDTLFPRFREIAAAGFPGPLVTLDGRPFYEAGATEAQEIAAIIAAAAWWLRAADAAGVSPAECLPHLSAGVAADRDQFLSIAKLRALQFAWGRFLELCDVPQRTLHVHAETGRRMLTCADPATNLLRNTIAALAAGVGGAHSIAVQPHTAALGRTDGNARALARNIQHLLLEEAHLFRVADAAAGAGLIEALTDGLAERAWTEFQVIEREGGILASLKSGAFRARIAGARAKLGDEVASGSIPLVGSTIYPAADEPDAATTPASVAASGLAALGIAPVRLEELAKAAVR